MNNQTLTGYQDITELQEVLDTQKLCNPSSVAGWNDIAYPLINTHVDLSSSAIAYDYLNSCLDVGTGSRFPDDPISFMQIVDHKIKIDGTFMPHVLWMQASAEIPNILLGYKVHKNGEEITDNTDYSSFTLIPLGTQVYSYNATHEYTAQMTQLANYLTFPDIEISDTIEWVIWRDGTNISGLFSASDPYATKWKLKSFIVHAEFNQDRGSRDELTK